MNLKQLIEQTKPMPGELAIFYLAQAGFYFKTAAGLTIGLDPYLSDCCERMFGFKRLIPSPLTPEEFRADFLVSTHSHADHLDPDLLEFAANNPAMRYVGSPDCLPLYEQGGISPERITILSAGERINLDGIEFRAVYADHGELAPEAVGMLLTLDGITVYAVGDTSYCPEKILESLGTVKVDIMIVPINPAFGNPGHENAVNLAGLVKPRIVIGSHFGMFAEHGGRPEAFLEYAGKTLSSAITPLIMKPGERLIYRQTAILKRDKLS